MSEILLYYKRPDPTTWVYMSSFLTIGLFFVFRRFWSIRNLDIILLILLAPGLLMVHEGRRRELVETEIAVHREQLRRDREATAASLQRMGFLFRAFPFLAVMQSNSDEAGADDSATEQVDDESTGDSAADDTGTDSSGESGDPMPISGDATADETDDVTPDKLSEEPDSSSEDLDALAEQAVPPFGEDDTFDAEMGRSQYTPNEIQRLGFIYLFVVESLILLRLMLDPLMVRRPLLDPNLTTGGLNFIGISLFIFMMANVVASTPRVQAQQGPELGPGYAMMNMLPAIPTRPVSDQPGGALPVTVAELTEQEVNLTRIAKVLAILAQLAIVSGIVLIANRHFGNTRSGVGCATLYLLLPYTAQMTGRVDHALPAALLMWAVLSYRRPFVSGIFMGLAGGLVYYPLFLLPLWVSFYWPRGARKFGVGVVAMLALLMVALSFDKSDVLTEHLQRMFGLLNPARDPSEFSGIWTLGWNPIWRLPVIVAFVILSAFFAIWPAQKNLGTLISGSAALMVAAQFWHGYGGGLYIAWFLPLLLLTIFRPNLQDRVATKVVAGGSRSERGTKSELAAV